MKSLKAYRHWTDLPLSRIAKGLIGCLLIGLMPGYAARVRAAPFDRAWPRLGRLIRNGQLTNAVRTKDHGLIRDFLASYWSSSASEEFYINLSHRYESLFLRYHSGIVERTIEATQKSGQEFNQLVEIGSGDGKILKYFSDRFPEISRVHGVDLNGEQTTKNHTIYREFPKLAFHHADAGEWLANNLTPGTILIANGGVLEYFTKPELEKLLESAARQAPSVIAITESIAADHNLESEPETFPYGLELSLSHNYVLLLRAAGFDVYHQYDRLTTPEESEIVGRWIQTVAVKEAMS